MEYIKETRRLIRMEEGDECSIDDEATPNPNCEEVIENNVEVNKEKPFDNIHKNQLEEIEEKPEDEQE